MIVSLFYAVSRTLLSVPAVLLRRDRSTDAELLAPRAKNYRTADLRVIQRLQGQLFGDDPEFISVEVQLSWQRRDT